MSNRQRHELVNKLDEYFRQLLDDEDDDKEIENSDGVDYSILSRRRHSFADNGDQDGGDFIVKRSSTDQKRSMGANLEEYERILLKWMWAIKKQNAIEKNRERIKNVRHRLSYLRQKAKELEEIEKISNIERIIVSFRRRR